MGIYKAATSAAAYTRGLDCIFAYFSGTKIGEGQLIHRSAYTRVYKVNI